MGRPTPEQTSIEEQEHIFPKAVSWSEGEYTMVYSRGTRVIFKTSTFSFKFKITNIRTETKYQYFALLD